MRGTIYLQMPQSLQWYCSLSTCRTRRCHQQANRTTTKSSQHKGKGESHSHRRPRTCTPCRSTPPCRRRSWCTLARSDHQNPSKFITQETGGGKRCKSERKLTGCSVSQTRHITCNEPGKKGCSAGAIGETMTEARNRGRGSTPIQLRGGRARARLSKPNNKNNM